MGYSPEEWIRFRYSRLGKEKWAYNMHGTMRRPPQWGPRGTLILGNSKKNRTKKLKLDDGEIENQIVGGCWIRLDSTRKSDVDRYTDKNMKDGIRSVRVLPFSLGQD